jgi:hypothetical protein
LPSSITKRFRSFRITAWAADSVPSTSKMAPWTYVELGPGSNGDYPLASTASWLNVGCPKLGNGTEESKVDPLCTVVKVNKKTPWIDRNETNTFEGWIGWIAR